MVVYSTEKLKKLRLKNGYSIYDMAKLIGISYSHYSLIENKKRNMSYEMAIKIAKVFKMKPDQLFL